MWNGSLSVKTSPFLFLGGSRGMFSLKAGPKKETATRASCPQEEAAKREGGREPSFPPLSPRGFRGWSRGGPPSKKMQLSNGVTTVKNRQHNGNYEPCCVAVSESARGLPSRHIHPALLAVALFLNCSVGTATPVLWRIYPTGRR